MFLTSKLLSGNIEYMENDFVDWVWGVLEDKGWPQAVISKHGIISAPQVSRVLNREQSPGIEFLKAVIDAFDMPPEIVFRHAGLMPPAKNKSPFQEEFEHIIDHMDLEDQEIYLDQGRLIVAQENKRRKKKARQQVNSNLD